MVNWRRGRKLGEGFYGEVHEAIPIGGDGPTMAVKWTPAEKASSLISERYFLEKLDSVPGVIPCLGGGYSDSIPQTYDLLLELAPDGSLLRYIDLCGKGGGFGIEESFVRFLTREILNTLASIHRLGVAHCDVKPGNILIFEDLKPKLADFGSAVEMRDVVPGACDYRGTVWYMSPEMVEDGKVTPAVDVWALGCTVLQMVTGDAPWKEWRKRKTEELKKKKLVEDGGALSELVCEELKKKIAKGDHPEIPSWMSEEGKDFLRLCFEKRSNRRPTAETLLQHPFVGRQKKKKKMDFHGCLLLPLPHLKFHHKNRAGVVIA